MPTILSKPTVGAFVLGLALVAGAIRKAGNKAAGGEQKQASSKLFVVRKSGGKDRVGVNGVFMKRMARIIPILVPGPLSMEAFYLVMVAGLMLVRTYCDVWMIDINTMIESSIISRNRKKFMVNLSHFAMFLLPIACVNNLLKYGLTELNMRFRKRLTKHLMKEYLTGYTYYQVANMDNRIANADQLLTQDVQHFCKSCTDLYSNLSKPLLDIGLYTYKLATTIGMQGPSNMLGYLVISGTFLNWLRRPVGRFTINEQRLEGDYRHVNSRVIQHSEEIAFYDGAEHEKGVVWSVFESLMRHIRRAQQYRFTIGVIDTFVAKYVATIVGFWVVSRPFLGFNSAAGIRTGDRAELMEDYYKSGRMLLRLAAAVGRLVLAGREMTRLAGFTQRVTELMDVLKDLNRGYYTRTMVSTDGNSGTGGPTSVRQMQGTVVLNDDVIEFKDVPLRTPNSDTLVESLNFRVERGQNVLIAGPNGCGKSSLFRVLGGLWPLFGGTLTKPPSSRLFYVPQRPYLVLGSLRDQIIYPDSMEDMAAKGVSDDDLLLLLGEVHLTHLVQREGGWDAVQDWTDRLSGGEKQRVAMARIFYHKPSFAILDECTSAVSVDVEGYMYNRCRELGITLFTVSHRKSLWKYHEFVLHMDGKGGYSFSPIDGVEVFGS